MKTTKENLVPFIALFIGFTVTIILLLPALFVADSDTSFVGYEVVFGTEFANVSSFASGEITFSILALTGFLSPLAAGIIAAFTKQSMLISAGLFALGAVLLFLVPVYTTATMTVLGSVTEIDIEWTYAFGLVIAAVLSTLGAVVSLVNGIKKRTT